MKRRQNAVPTNQALLQPAQSICRLPAAASQPEFAVLFHARSRPQPIAQPASRIFGFCYLELGPREAKLRCAACLTITRLFTSAASGPLHA